MRTIPLLCLSVAAALLLAPSVRADDRAYSFVTPADLTVSSNVTMPPDDAEQIRRLADSNLDGTINATEAKRTEDQFRQQAEQSASTKDLLDNATPISRVFVSATLDGLLGPRNSTEPLIARAVAKLTFRPSEAPTHEFKRVVTSEAGMAFALSVPPGMEVKNVAGLENMSREAGRAGGNIGTANVVVLFGPAPASQPTETPSTPAATNENQDSGNDHRLVGLGVPAMLAAVGIALLGLRSRR